QSEMAGAIRVGALGGGKEIILSFSDSRNFRLEEFPIRGISDSRNFRFEEFRVRVISGSSYLRSDFVYSLLKKSIISSRRSYNRLSLRGARFAKAYAAISGNATVEST